MALNVRRDSDQDGQAPPRPKRFGGNRKGPAMLRGFDGHISAVDVDVNPDDDDASTQLGYDPANRFND